MVANALAAIPPDVRCTLTSAGMAKHRLSYHTLPKMRARPENGAQEQGMGALHAVPPAVKVSALIDVFCAHRYGFGTRPSGKRP